MEAKINDDELKLLVWLHEHARAYNEGAGLDADKVARDLQISDVDLLRAASYLSGHGLVGLGKNDFTHSRSDGQEMVLSYVYLTSFGENYVRNIEDAPGVTQRLTMAALTKLGDVATKAAAIVFTEILTQHLQPIRP